MYTPLTKKAYSDASTDLNTSLSNERGVNAGSRLDVVLITKLLKVVKAKSRNRSHGNRYRRSPERGPRKCWTCGAQDHLALDHFG